MDPMSLHHSASDAAIPWSLPRDWGLHPGSWGMEWRQHWKPYFKRTILFAVWVAFTVMLMMNEHEIKEQHYVTIIGLSDLTVNTSVFWIKKPLATNRMQLFLEGPFHKFPDKDGEQLTVSVQVVVLKQDIFGDGEAPLGDIPEEDVETILEPKEPGMEKKWEIEMVTTAMQDYVVPVKVHQLWVFQDIDLGNLPDRTVVRVLLSSSQKKDSSVNLEYDLQPIENTTGVVCALVILMGLYVLIIFELIHRAMAAIIASTLSVSCLAALGKKPTLQTILSWIDVETMLLLFSMMVIVAILTKTGVFDYLAVVAYKVTKGRVWPLIFTLCLFTGISSCIIDNVTTVLLMTPVTIRLCEVLILNPVPVLMCIIMSCNILGALTPIGDPPNIIISTNPEVIAAGVNFGTFTMHMGIGVILATLTLFLQLRYVIYRNMNKLKFDEPQEVEELRHELAIWQRTASSLSQYTKDEAALRQILDARVNTLTKNLHVKRGSMTSQVSAMTQQAVAHREFLTMLQDLQQKYPVRDKGLLIKCILSLIFAIFFFFAHSVLSIHISLGWVALLSTILLLILVDRDDIEGLLARVEWSTLIFFAALFVLMEALSELGLIVYIGNMTEKLILMVPKEQQLIVGVVLILWVSAIASAFVDNIPLTTMMVRIVNRLSKNKDLNLPLQPMIWALAFGGCFGGNGTLIGSSANVVCSGVAEQHGYKFSFVGFFKIGFPVMLVSVVIVTFYLLMAHAVFQWHDIPVYPNDTVAPES